MRLIVLALALAACSKRAALPEDPPPAAALGRCGGSVDREALCSDWSDAVSSCDGDAADHASFPELDPRSCFVRVRYRPGRLPRPDPIPRGCGYPTDARATSAQLEREADRYQQIARGARPRMPMALDCALTKEARVAAARHNERTLRALARRLERGERHAYSAVSTFGFGHAAAGASALVGWLPGDECVSLDKREMDLFYINLPRAGRAAEAYHGGVAPVVTVSGGAVHSPLTEAFLLLYLLSCTFDVPADAVLLDPCADHTHTNVRNTGGLVRALGGRTAYVVTSDGLQAQYLQEWSVFSLVGGSIDARALRDWGYLLGSWRQASEGIDAGFWFTPYRFWGEPTPGLGEAACVR
jgi:hypothetical protein